MNAAGHQTVWIVVSTSCYGDEHASDSAWTTEARAEERADKLRPTRVPGKRNSEGAYVECVDVDE